MLLDPAVVALENIYRHLQMGKPRLQAAYEGTVEVWGALLASTLTTVAIFLPVVFVQDEAGQLFRDIAIAVSASILVSMLVAMTVIPALSARLDFSAVMERMRRIRARISLQDSARRFQNLGVDVFIGSGRFTGRDKVMVGGKELRFDRAVIATGARAVVPPIDGLAAAGLADQCNRLAWRHVKVEIIQNGFALAAASSICA